LSLGALLGMASDDHESFGIVVELQRRRWTLSVPTILGERELIRWPVDALVASAGTVGASAMLDDGRLVLLIQLGGVLQRHPFARGPSREPRSATRATSTTRRRTILVVDDSRIVCDLIREILLGEGYDVRVAHDGSAALAAFAEKTPDLVLTDLEMP